ncbi:MAG: DUF3141 domain-containing protein [Acetobacteraceae bacterium]
MSSAEMPHKLENSSEALLALPPGTPHEDLTTPAWPGLEMFSAASEYWQDTFQRSILFLDVLRRRGDTYLAQTAKLAPNVLSFQTDLVLDGQTLPRPVNYALMRVRPPEGVVTDPRKRPFIIFDPRAGQDPRNRRHEARQRNRRHPGPRPPVLFRQLPAPARARPDDRGCLPGRGAVRRGGGGLHPDAEANPAWSAIARPAGRSR